MSQSQNQAVAREVPGLRYSPSLTKEQASEVFDEQGQPKEHWRYLLDSLDTLGSSALNERHKKAQRILRDDGATYNIYGNPANPSKTWELDLVPALIDSAEWGIVESGLLERAELLNALLKDIYGPRDLIRLGVIPPEVVFGHGGYLRPCHGISMAGEHELILHAVDMVRMPSGELQVLADRTQAPSGMGYALENRTVMSRVLPSLFRDSHVHRLASFFQIFRKKLGSLSSTHEAPRVVLLSPGVHNEAYFEHAYLSNYLGLPLVQSGDLVVRNGFLWMKSLDGLNRVDVVFRRVDDSYCDPVELRSDSLLGVPNLLEVARAGNVAIANPLGSGVLENPIFLKYMPAISKALLGRTPRIRSIETYWCGDRKDMQYVKEHFSELVIKPTLRAPNSSSVLVSSLKEQDKQSLLATIMASPSHYVAQPCVIASHLPTFHEGQLCPRPSILRTFAVANETSYSMMPGGLTRVGSKADSFLISNQVGAQSKDTWVIASEPERAAPAPSKDIKASPTEVQQNSLPSRVVENLFWMGRYAERAETSLRLLRTVFVLLNGEERLSDASREQLLKTVTEVTSTLPGFKGFTAEQFKHPEQELTLLVSDPTKLGSVHHSLNAMLNCADESKELLSSDTLRVINDIRDALLTMRKVFAHGLGPAPDEALDPLVTALMALSGLSHESMVRNIGWQFMEIGRRIERGTKTITLITELLSLTFEESDENTLMQALLLSLEALISYRRRYRASFGAPQVLDLVMLDSTNPRSLVFQFDQLMLQIESLPRVKTTSFELSKEQRYVLEAVTQIKLSVLTNLCKEDDGGRPALTTHLSKLSELLAQLSITISDKYFDHRIDSQQLVQNNWES